MELTEIIEGVARCIEVLAVAIIVLGIANAARLYAYRGAWTDGSAYKPFKNRVGSSLLLGLEFLVAADVVETVAVAPTLQRVAILGLLVVIRTFLSWSLVVEIEGRWPWQPERSAVEGATLSAATGRRVGGEQR